MTHPTVDRSGVRDSALPLLASVCATAAAAAALIVTAKAGLLYDNGRWGFFLCGAAALLAMVAGWWAFRLMGFDRRRLTIRTTVAALVIGATMVWGTNAIASQVWKNAWQRYTDELGGPGACLSGTPYGERWASTITMTVGDDNRPMEVWPGTVDGSTRATPTKVLRLHFDKSRTRPLTPADATSRELLTSYGCR
ncbi:hypothetical protein [Streptomyces sp. NPDC051992]|uniref:hypothetical protein n=1 Tax=Streptomyces sp. NPDC051992 TaxID=3161012 RepID=UPI003445FED6